MKQLLKSIILGAVATFLFCSCEIGLGEAIDLEKPIIKAKTLEHFDSEPVELKDVTPCKKDVTIKGICYDNKKVESVIVEKQIDIDNWQNLGNASINGDEFIATVKFENTGHATLKFTARDAFGNTEKDQITLAVEIE